MEYIIGALVMWWVVSFIEEETHICGVLEFPMLVTQIVLTVLSFPFICIYRIFFRHTIKLVTYEQVTKANILKDSKHLFDDLYIVLTRTQKSFGTRFFFLESNQLYLITLPVVQKGSSDLGKNNLPLLFLPGHFISARASVKFSPIILYHIASIKSSQILRKLLFAFRFT